jgi:hypothetical protein
MRDYAKVCPKAWHGDTLKALRKRGAKALLVGLYLMTSPSSNMLGIFPQPILYMAHETGLGEEGAMEGLRACLEEGFCDYDPDSEVVWVFEMARYQIASELKASDLRCKGIQKEYDALPNNPFLADFFDHYQAAFHLTKKRAFKAPCQGSTKPLRSQEQEQEQEQEQDTSGKAGEPAGDKSPRKTAEEMSKTELWNAAVSLLSEQHVPEPQARSFIGKLSKDYKAAGEDIVLTAVRGAVSEQPADARAYLKATCQRLAGERRKDGGSDWTRTAE